MGNVSSFSSGRRRIAQVHSPECMDPPQFRSMFFEVHRKVVKILKTIIESAGQGRFENRKMIRISAARSSKSKSQKLTKFTKQVKIGNLNKRYL